MTRNGTVHFSIEPAWIAERVRDCVLSRDWRHGQRILNCLVDADGNPPSAKLCNGVMSGSMTITGPDNEPEFTAWEDEDAEQYRKELAYIHPPFCRDPGDGSCWTPYAIVLGGGPPDMEYALESGVPMAMDRVLSDGVKVDPAFVRKRAEFYADKPGDDRVVILNEWTWDGDKSRTTRKGPFLGMLGAIITLWRRVVDPPIWMEPITHGFWDEAFGGWRARAGTPPLDIRGPQCVVSLHTAPTPTQLRNIGYDADGFEIDEDDDFDNYEPGAAILSGMEEMGLPPDIMSRAADSMQALFNEDEDKDLSPAASFLAQAKRRAERVSKIRTQAGEALHHFTWTDAEGHVRRQDLPRALLAAYSVYKLRHVDSGAWEAAKGLWETICRSGLKMLNDDPWHSDLVLAAGFRLDEAYPDQTLRRLKYEKHDNAATIKLEAEHVKLWHKAVLVLAGKLQAMHRKETLAAWVAGGGDLEETRMTKLDAEIQLGGRGTVLCGSGTVRGIVVTPGPDTEVEPGSIVVTPHAGVEHYMAAVTAHREGGGAVIAETGGVTAHLSVEGLEAGFRVLVLPDALEFLAPGDEVVVNMREGSVTKIHSSSDL